MPQRIEIFDSTLRDGAQAEGISFSVEDKLKIAKALDELGVAYIEAGNPGSNPKDIEFFEKMRTTTMKNAKLTAFGSTRRRDTTVENDKNVQSLVTAYTPAVAIFGKTWDFHVTEIIKTTLDENLKMVKETLAYFKKMGKEVIFDAEHFFDGYSSNPQYAFKVLEAAVEGGADCLVLCDTNGACFPSTIFDLVKKVKETFKIKVGIHTHNDCGMAVANSIMAVEAGAEHVQGTYIGFGERCGNANLSTIIPNLQLKKGINCIPEEKMSSLTFTARKIAEIANISLNKRDPYVGSSAFAHKGGMHIDGVCKASASFEHIDPELVGNKRKFLMSEVSGRNTILEKIREINPTINKESKETHAIVQKLKELEHQGYQFEGAESTFELIIRKQLGKYKPFFELEKFKLMTEQPDKAGKSASALIKVKVDGVSEITAAEGHGPVHALDKALRKALEVFYPELSHVHLTDFKVRVIDSKSATAAKVRVLIESTDGESSWTTVGVSTDIIEASWIALVDSIEYKLLKELEKKIKVYI
ncbi:MAG: citramalate synthase [Clostridiaceae bacterium]|jgi:2-isopropylmalate synthase|nr:citramalate synthase [Clostridiaceae bacterium]